MRARIRVDLNNALRGTPYGFFRKEQHKHAVFIVVTAYATGSVWCVIVKIFMVIHKGSLASS